MEICEPGMQGICPSSDICEQVHHDKPYIWEIQPEGAQDWLRFNDAQQQYIEQQFADPAKDGTYAKIMMTQADGFLLEVDVAIDFNRLVCYQGGSQQMMQVRRTSTNSYGASYLARARGDNHTVNANNLNTFHTLWIWYYHHGNAWHKFGEDGHSPLQSIIETKYLAKQEILRFVVPPEPAEDSRTFLLDYRQCRLLQAGTRRSTPVRRRPEFMSHDQVINKKWLTFPPWKNPTYLATLPVNWFPINPACEFELVPLNPNSMEFHLIVSEFVRTMMRGRILDVFRVQNPFLWNKYMVKKDYMTDRLGKPNELQLFHGTSDEGAVQAILRQNFDWRMSGKNATKFGRGSYFARDASFSDKYSSRNSPFKWMFMARILAGRFTLGHKDYNRPPPIDPMNRFGDIYDSCVDDMNDPRRYVIFENDQCYPEYLFSYTDA